MSLSFSLVFVMSCCGCVTTKGITSNASSGALVKVNKKSITIDKTGRVKVFSKNTKSFTISCSVKDESICECKWSGKFKRGKNGYNYTYLKIKGLKNGKTRIILTNSRNKKKLTLSVRIKGFKDYSSVKKDSLALLNKRLKETGLYKNDEYGEYYCIPFHEEDDDYYFQISRYISDGSYEFYCVSPDVVCKLKCSSDMSGYGEYECEGSITSSISITYEGTGSVPIKTISRGEEIDLMVSAPRIVFDKCAKLINLHLHHMLAGINLLLISEVGVSLEEIGFKNYV